MQSGLRYLEAFFGMLITIMCVMFGWMVSFNSCLFSLLHVHTKINKYAQYSTSMLVLTSWPYSKVQ